MQCHHLILKEQQGRRTEGNNDQLDVRGPSLQCRFYYTKKHKRSCLRTAPSGRPWDPSKP